MKKVLIALIALGCVFSFANAAHALVSDLPDVGGQGYFLDSDTGNKWMDVDNFFGLDYNQIESAISGTGYKIATYAQIAQLHSSLPFSNYSSWSPIVGDYDRGYTRIVWGFYDPEQPGSLFARESWMYSDLQTFTGGVWNYSELGGPGWGPYWVAKDGSSTDRGAWVVLAQGGQENPTIPEPASLSLLGLGLIGFLGRKRI